MWPMRRSGFQSRATSSCEHKQLLIFIPWFTELDKTQYSTMNKIRNTDWVYFSWFRSSEISGSACHGACRSAGGVLFSPCGNVCPALLSERKFNTHKQSCSEFTLVCVWCLNLAVFWSRCVAASFEQQFNRKRREPLCEDALNVCVATGQFLSGGGDEVQGGADLWVLTDVEFGFTSWP